MLQRRDNAARVTLPADKRGFMDRLSAMARWGHCGFSGGPISTAVFILDDQLYRAEILPVSRSQAREGERIKLFAVELKDATSP